MKVSILLGLVFLLLVMWTLRRPELFQDTTQIRGPPYSAEDAQRIVSMMPTAMVDRLKDLKQSTDPMRLIDGLITQLFTQFWQQKYQPASTTLTSGDVDEFLTSATVSPLTKSDVKTLLVAYFVSQAHGATNAAVSASQTAAAAASASYASNSGYGDVLAGMGQSAGYSAGPAGGSSSSGGTGGTGSSGGGGGTGSSGGGGGSSSTSGGGGGTSGGGGGTSGGTGGTGTAGAGRTGSQFDRSVTAGFVMPVGGPVRPDFAGPQTNVIESTARVYPDLIGPGGGGVAGPAGASAGGTTNAGSAPWTGQSTFDFNLFSASQVPGDQDLIQNPYLQSAIFTPSTYSAKNEPVPYLADFSAFMR